MHPGPRRSLAPFVAALAAACSGGGGGSASPLANDAPPEVLVCRARVDQPFRFAEVSLRSAQNLGGGRVAERAGTETGARLHPDGVRVVFARERQNDDPDSRELFVSTVDSSASELRLTIDTTRDDDPVWSPDGQRVLFTSERGGAAGLWTCTATGDDAQPLLPPPAGFADGEPDWHAGTGRIVFSRRDDATGRHALWLVSSSGTGQVPLTDGGAGVAPGAGDRQPAWSPDGASVVFVRRLDDERATLCLCEVATGDVTVRYAPLGDGEVARPRFDPASDRLWFGLAEPGVGRQTLRLAVLPLAPPAAPAADLPTLVWPDERWRFEGIDFLDALLPPPNAAPVERLDLDDATIQVALARNSFGAQSQLLEDDDNEFYLETAESGGRQVAGLNCRVTLPVDDAEDVVEVRVRARARVSRIGGDSLLRMSLRNLSDNRYDTVIERAPASTDEQELTFRTSSLRHVSREKRLQFTVIADIDPGDPVDVWVDLIEVELVKRAP